MAGTNGKPKFLRCNREDEVDDLKIRGTLFQYMPTTTLLVNSITPDQWLQPFVSTGTLAGPIAGPSGSALFALQQQQAPGVTSETGTLIFSNPSLNDVVIAFPSGFTPAQITIPAGTNVRVLWRLASTNPPSYEIIGMETIGTANPANIPVPPPANFPPSPAQPFDVIVRNATNTAWVASGFTDGGHMPWLNLNGVAGPLNNALQVSDLLPLGSNNLNNLVDLVIDQDQNNFPDFSVIRAGVDNTNFGNRGVGTTDNIFHAVINTPPGVQPNSYFFRGSVLPGADPFYVRTSGVTKITLSAGPPVTPLAIDALGQICADVSSATVKENIMDVSATEFVNNFNVREFNFIGDNIKQIGAIVQELEPLIPANLRPAIINYRINFAYTDNQGVFHPMTRDLSQPQSINLQGVLFALLEEHQKLRARVALLENP